MAGTDCRPTLLRQWVGRPQLKRDPLGSPHQWHLSAKPLFTSYPMT